MEGEGLILDKDNKLLYEGDFEKDKKNGFGKAFLPNNEFYSGNFVDNKFEGRGIYQFENGDTWEGPFKNNCKNGIGVLTKKSDGKKYIVIFEMDNFMGKTNLEDKEKKELEEAKKEVQKIKEDMEKKKD